MLHEELVDRSIQTVTAVTQDNFAHLEIGLGLFLLARILVWMPFQGEFSTNAVEITLYKGDLPLSFVAITSLAMKFQLEHGLQNC